MTAALDALAQRVDDLASVAERTDGTVTAEHVPFLAQVDLRLDPSRAGLAPYPLPMTPNTAWEDGPRAALWLGPDEWMILGPPHAGANIVAQLETALGGEVHRSVVDVSASRVAIELGGPERFELLSKGCSLDLHPRAWRRGLCAQTMLARAQVIMHERERTTGLLVRSSFADYLVDRLLATLG